MRELWRSCAEWGRRLSGFIPRLVKNHRECHADRPLVLEIHSLMNPYWIEAGPFRLAILPRPRGYDWLAHDIAAARRSEVNVIVSALTVAETLELGRSEEHTSELQSLTNLVCRLLLEKKKKKKSHITTS